MAPPGRDAPQERPEPAYPAILWTEGGVAREARWQSVRGAPPPARVRVVDDRLTADEAYGEACQGTALLWRGDFHNGRQLLAALDRRALRRTPRRASSARAAPGSAAMGEAFHRERQARAQRARTLGMLLVQIEGDGRLALRRAPGVAEACTAALGPAVFAPTHRPMVMSLRELQGILGAHQWRLRGLEVPAAGGRIHPHYGVFAPVRSEYVALVAEAPLPAVLAGHPVAVDVGTGTGVLAAVLARRGIGRVIATDQDPRALACARDNLAALGLARQVEVRQADLFPGEAAALVVCNPPWIPARPASPLEHAIYDPDGRMLHGFLRGLAAQLVPGGEGWLVLSDLAERLGLRTGEALLGAAERAGLQVAGRLDARPAHPRASDEADPFHELRAAEVTSLWRLRPR